MKIFLILILILLTACSTKRPEGKTEAETLYKEAEALMKDKRYIMATEKLNNLKNKYPYSFYATPAELLQADILFKQENYIEAAAAYMVFRDFHPKHEKIAYVIFRIAESYYKQLPETIDRDLDVALEAIRYATEIVENYKASAYVDESHKIITKCNEMLIGKEKYVADFYFKTEVYEAAVYRYLEILNNFNVDEALKKHSMKRVVIGSFNAKNYEKCIQYADQFFQFFDKKDRTVIEKTKQNCLKQNSLKVE